MAPKGTAHVVRITTAGNQILPSNVRRIGLIFPRPIAQRYTVAPDAVPADSEGLNMPTGHDAVILDHPEMRGLVQKAWFGISNIADQNIMIFEAFE